MPFPDSLTTITLTGTMLHGDGSAKAGAITIKLSAPIRSTTDNVIIPQFGYTVTLVAGGFSVTLPATTDPDWIPNTAEYVIQAVFDDQRKLWWSFPLPHTLPGATYDLADATPNVGTPTVMGTAVTVQDGGYRSTWSDAVVYRPGDTVEHAGSAWGALKASADIEPGTDATAWQEYPSAGGGVSSFEGRTGDVTGQAGDYAVADITGLQAALDAKQASDADLTAIAGLTATTDNIIQSVGSAWASRTPTQVKTALALNNVTNTSDADKPVSTAQQAALDGKSNTGHLHAAADVTSGTLDIARIPTGSTGSTVPFGNDARFTDTRTPTDNTVSTAKLIDGAVTLAKLASIGAATLLGNNTAGSAAPIALTATEAKALLAIAQSDVSGLTAALALLAPLASPAFTGTATAVGLTQSGRYLMSADALTDAATIAINASLGNIFTVTLGGNRTLGSPTNSVGNMEIVIVIRQDATGSRTLAYDAVWRFGTTIPTAVPSVTANSTSYLRARYHSGDTRWDVIDFVTGF